MTFSFSDKIKEKLIHYLNSNQLYELALYAFEQAKTDYDKVELCWLLLNDSSLFPQFDSLPAKSVEFSEQFRLKGNHEFANKRDVSAIKLYTMAAGRAPQDSQELVLAIANRSAVTNSLDEHADCIRDINFCLSRNYPVKLKYKLLERKGKSLICQGLYREAEEVLKEALESLSSSGLSENKLLRVKTSIEALLERCDENINLNYENPPNSPNNHTPVLSNGRNEIIPNASSSIKIAYTEEMGRHLVATTNIFPGEVLAMEDPYISILLPQHYGVFCSHCLKRCHSLIPCQNCSQAYYCSDKCRSAAQSIYHEVECSLLGHFVSLGCTKMELLVARTLVVAGGQGRSLDALHRLIESVDTSCTIPDEKGFSNGIYNSHSYEAVHFLEGNTRHRSTMDLFSRSIAAACILYLIDTYSRMFDHCPKLTEGRFKLNHDNELDLMNGHEEDLCYHSNTKEFVRYLRQRMNGGPSDSRVFAGGLLLKYLQIMPSNAHEVSEMFIEGKDFQCFESVEIGGGLYPLLSLTNHSCVPNVVRHSYNGSTVVLTAIQVISPGEQIFDNYGYHHAIHDRVYRQIGLLTQYHFYCKCVACMDNWPLYNGMPSSDPHYLPGADIVSLQEGSAKFGDIVKEVMELNSENKLNFLCRHLQLMHWGIQRPWKQYSECQEVIKQCLSLRANHYVVH